MLGRADLPERAARAAGVAGAAEDGALDDYTYTCRRHIELVAGPGYVVTPVELGEGEPGEDGGSAG